MLVYHFLPADYGLQNLRKRRLKLARFHELNDPFEFAAAELRSRPERRAFMGYKNDMAKSFGMLCFSRTWRNPVLWSHYADKHTGLCLGFEVRRGLLMPVRYTDSRLVIAPNRPLRHSDLNKQIAERLLTTKFRDWHYENELRVFATLDERDRRTGLYFCKFDENVALRTVIAGPRCDVTKKAIESALGDWPNVVLVKARLAFRTFRVVKDRLGFRQTSLTR